MARVGTNCGACVPEIEEILLPELVPMCSIEYSRIIDEEAVVRGRQFGRRKCLPNAPPEKRQTPWLLRYLIIGHMFFLLR